MPIDYPARQCRTCSTEHKSNDDNMACFQFDPITPNPYACQHGNCILQVPGLGRSARDLKGRCKCAAPKPKPEDLARLRSGISWLAVQAGPASLRLKNRPKRRTT